MFFFLKTKSHYVALAGLELTMWTRLSSNSEKSTHLFLWSLEIKGV